MRLMIITGGIRGGSSAESWGRRREFARGADVNECRCRLLKFIARKLKLAGDPSGGGGAASGRDGTTRKCNSSPELEWSGVHLRGMR